MSAIDRLLRRPERATGTRAQQVLERYRMAEYRLERETLRQALTDLAQAVQDDPEPITCPAVLEAMTHARDTLDWAAMREQAREISTKEGLT